MPGQLKLGENEQKGYRGSSQHQGINDMIAERIQTE
jgi:hypothetical protein